MTCGADPAVATVVWRARDVWCKPCLLPLWCGELMSCGADPVCYRVHAHILGEVYDESVYPETSACEKYYTYPRVSCASVAAVWSALSTC